MRAHDLRKIQTDLFLNLGYAPKNLQEIIFRNLNYMPLLTAKFYQQTTKKVARTLLGKLLCYRDSSGKLHKARIVETEAYLGIKDPACHTFNGRRTERVKSMYCEGGHAYIYMIYGLFYCLNVVTRGAEQPEAVLIRAIEPMQFQPGLRKLSKTQLQANGPGKLCRYLGLTKAQDGIDLRQKKSCLWIEEAKFGAHHLSNKDIVVSRRIGVDYAGAAAKWPLRYYIKGNIHVSRK